MKYVSDHNGSTTGAGTGRKYKYAEGEPFEAPPGEFPHVDGITRQDSGQDPEPAAETVQEPEPEQDDSGQDPTSDNEFDNLPDDTEFPYHYGGGNYFLSNGERVSGKRNAEEAQAELDG